MQVGRRVLRTALIAGSALGLTAGGSVLALASGSAAQAATTCAAAWSSATVYTGGQQASENGINYTANWWTQGNDPATSNGGSGSGQPWTSNGSCTGGSGSGSGGGSGRDRGGSGWGPRLGHRPALQPVQGRHHQHELEHRPDAVGRGRVRHSGGRLRQPGVEYVPKLPASRSRSPPELAVARTGVVSRVPAGRPRTFRSSRAPA